MLEKLGTNPRALLQQANTAIGALPRMTTPPAQVHVSNELIRLLDAAQTEAERLKDDYTSTEHFLLALADDQSKGKAGQILRSAGVTRDRVYQALQQVRGGQRVTSQNPESTYQSLERYGRDLTAAGPRAASSTRSSAATRRSAGSSRSSPAGPRTTRS